MKRLLLLLLVPVVALGAMKFVASLKSTSGASVNTIVATATSTYQVWAAVHCDADANVQTGVAYSDGGGVTAVGTDPLIIGGDVPEKFIELLPGENGLAIAGADGGSANCWAHRLYQY